MKVVSQTLFEYDSEKVHSVKYKVQGGQRSHYEPKVNLGEKPYPRIIRVTVEAVDGEA